MERYGEIVLTSSDTNIPGKEKFRSDLLGTKQLYTILDLASRPAVDYITNPDLLQVSFKYGEGSYTIEFGLLGVNQIFHPKVFTIKDINGIPTWSFTTDTDWVSPYFHLSDYSIDTACTEYVCGGNHGANGNTVPTAKRISTEIYADGVRVYEGSVGNAEEVKVVTVNRILPGNITITGSNPDSDYVMEETVTYTITSNNVEVATSLYALKSLKILGYVGLQLTGYMFPSATAKLYFNDGSGFCTLDNSLHNSTHRCDRCVLTNGDDAVVMYTERDVGLGKLTNFRSTDPAYFKAAFNKIYGHLVYIPLILTQGETAYYRGGYTFQKLYPVKDINGQVLTEVNSYKILNNKQAVYCIDFPTGRSEAYVELPPETRGRSTDILSRRLSATIDEVISAKGLRVQGISGSYLSLTLCDEATSEFETSALYQSEASGTSVEFLPETDTFIDVTNSLTAEVDTEDHTISGYSDSVIIVKGKNIFNFGEATYTDNCTVSLDGNDVIVTSLGAGDAYALSSIITLKPNTSYTMSYQHLVPDESMLTRYPSFVWFNPTSNTPVDYQATHNTRASIEYVRLGFYCGAVAGSGTAGETVTYSSIQLEENTEATLYESPDAYNYTLTPSSTLYGLTGAEDTINNEGVALHNTRLIEPTSVLVDLTGHEAAGNTIYADTHNLTLTFTSNSLTINPPEGVANSAFASWASTNNYKVLYQLAAPVSEDITAVPIVATDGKHEFRTAHGTLSVGYTKSLKALREALKALEESV